jgi:gamma-glutamyl-gamma-aminobutyrate hydrolase PuuD
MLNKRIGRLTFLFLFLFCIFGALASVTPCKVGLILNEGQWKSWQQGTNRLADVVKLIQANGGTVVCFYVGESDQVLAQQIKEIDALLLPGGDDVNPQYYHEQAHEKLEKVDDSLDRLEFQLMDSARKQRIPILGICRGLQIINVWLGGTLYQDIPSQFGKKVIHRIKKNDKLKPCYHQVKLEGPLAGLGTIKSNSYHHQGIKDLAPGLQILGRTKDGLIEALENSNQVDSTILAVQFHPELDLKSSMNLLIKRFFDIVKESKH